MSLDDAFALHNEGRLEEAKAAYRELIAAGDEDGEASYWLATIADPDEAEPLWRVLAERGQQRALPGLAWLLYSQPGRDAEAEAVFEQAMSAEGMLRGLGQLVARDPGRALEAETILREAAIADPWALRPLARLLAAQPGRFEEAEVVFATAIESGDPDAARSLANALARVPERIADAEAAYRAAIVAGDQGAWRGLGVMLERQGRIDEAERAFRTAIEHGDIGALPDHASILLVQRRAAEATEALRAAAANGDELAQVRLALTLDDEMALATYREAVAAGNQRAWLILVGLLSDHLAEGPELAPPGNAEQDLVPAGDVEPELEARAAGGDVAALAELAARLAAQGRGAEAADAFREAAHAGALDALIGVALLSGLSGDKRQAEEALRAAAFVGNADASLLLGALLTDVAREDAATAYRAAIEAGRADEGRRGLEILGK